MPQDQRADGTRLPAGARVGSADGLGDGKGMATFVESCVETAAGSAVSAQRRGRGRPGGRKLIKLLAGKRRILVTTHEHPDPDGLASALAMSALLRERLPSAEVCLSVKGSVGGGLNEAFVRYAKLNLIPWDASSLRQFDAIILLDAQPAFAYNPLPADIKPFAIIDHHGSVGRRPHCPFCDIRTGVGATSSIVFSYFMQTQTPIGAGLAAALLYGIETDLAGAAGAPTELDNVALSSLTLVADTRRLYQMRYVDLPRSYYIAYAQALAAAQWHEHALVSHLPTINSLEEPAVLADFLLRFDQVDWALVTGLYEGKLILSLRTSDPKQSASQVMKGLIRRLGQGGGHKNKAGGYVDLQTASPAQAERIRTILSRRYLRLLGIKPGKGEPLVPPT
jgi:nanoRNase/pAp phosphatase (c-di-AMP/oligoRNAs hydrolase)